ncbi:hypothetical protein Pfo_009409, partial [Paulownia fortunei]
MAIFHYEFFFSSLLIFCKIVEVYPRGPVYAPPDVEILTDRFSRVSVNKSYDVSFGGSNIHVTNNGTSADLSLDKSSGSGLVSKNKYYYGFFNAAIKLPAGFTSGVVVAYYKGLVLQTNIYGNGSVSTGREEKFYLWFDPTESFHDYSILWNNHHI